MKAKLLVLGSSDSCASALMNRFSSLNIEHVSPSRLKESGISRRQAPVLTDEATTVARMRHWYFARKLDAGFLLTDFPATLLQAKVFDEWLDCRNEALDAVFASSETAEPIVEHYRALGLLADARKLAQA
jgi:adenylate kinase